MLTSTAGAACAVHGDGDGNDSGDVISALAALGCDAIPEAFHNRLEKTEVPYRRFYR